MTGIELIARERRRQIDEEGWTAGCDDTQNPGALSIAAACYALRRTDAKVDNPDSGDGMDGWPWDKEYDKRDQHSNLKCLVIAGALIAAEIDRELRLSASQRCRGVSAGGERN